MACSLPPHMTLDKYKYFKLLFYKNVATSEVMSNKTVFKIKKSGIDDLVMQNKMN